MWPHPVRFVHQLLCSLSSCSVVSVVAEFFKDGKYDLDFKNKASDPSKWVCCNTAVDWLVEVLKLCCS